MDTPLYKLYFLKRLPAFFELSGEEWAALRAEFSARQTALGIRDLINAEMAWSNEVFEFFGVEYYPSAEAVQTYTRSLADLGFFRYLASESYLGIPMDASYPDFVPEPPEPGSRAVYRLYLARERPCALALPTDVQEQLNAGLTEELRRVGGRALLGAYTRWNNERWEYFGVERFPTLEAVISYSQFLSSSGWYRNVDACSYLGVAFGGLVTGLPLAGLAEDVQPE